MTTIKVGPEHDGIYNDAGFQLIGSHAPGQEGLSPRELLEAALGLCVSIVLQKKLVTDGIACNPQEIQVEVTASKPEDGANRFSDFKVQVRFPFTLDPVYKAKLKVIAERACTISNTLKAPAEVELLEV